MMLKPYFLILALSFSYYGFTQREMKRVVIAPNLSVTYESSTFKVNSLKLEPKFGTETAEFLAVSDSKYNIKIELDAGRGGPLGTLKATMKRELVAVLNYLSSNNGDSIAILNKDTGVREFKGFYFVGLVSLNKRTNVESTTILGVHLTEADRTGISYSSSGRNDLEKEYEVISRFLNGFRVHSPEDVKKLKDD